MSSARLATLLLLPVLVGFDRFAYYAVRAILVMDLRSRFAVPLASMGPYFTALSLSLCAASLLGGALAIVTGPRLVAIVGAVVAMLAYVTAGLGVRPEVGVGLMGLGVGLLRVAPWAILGDVIAREDTPSGLPEAPLSPRRFPMMASMAMLIFGAANVASFLSPVVAGATMSRLGAAAVYFMAAGIMLVVLVLAIVLAVLPLAGRARATAAPPQPVYRAPAPAFVAPPPTSSGAPLLGLLALAASTIPYELALPVSYSAQVFLGIRPEASAVPAFVTVLVAFAGFVLFLAAALQRWSFSPLWPFGAALVLFGLGLAPIALASNALMFVAGSAVISVAEPVLSAIGLTYAALAVGERWRGLTIAIWLAVSSLLSLLPAVGDLWRWELGFFVLMSISFGILVIALGSRLHAWAFEPPVVNAPGLR